MLRTFFENHAFSTIWISAIAGVVCTIPSSVASQTPVTPNSEIDSPVCFIQAESGEILDLTRLCVGSGSNRMVTSASIKRLMTTKQCLGCSLQGANLIGTSLRGVDLKRAQLGGAKLSNTSLPFANLEGATLNNADLTGANLLGANLAGANLAGANLRGANLRGAFLQGANLKGTIMPDGTIRN